MDRIPSEPPTISIQNIENRFRFFVVLVRKRRRKHKQCPRIRKAEGRGGHSGDHQDATRFTRLLRLHPKLSEVTPATTNIHCSITTCAQTIFEQQKHFARQGALPTPGPLTKAPCPTSQHSKNDFVPDPIVNANDVLQTQLHGTRKGMQ